MKRQNGFTLIELLAVIVILGIIMVIAIPSVMHLIKKSRVDAAEASGEIYVDTLNKELLDLIGYGEELESKKYDIAFFDNYFEMQISGSKPSKGFISINDEGTVLSANLCIDDYIILYQNGSVSASGETCSSKLYKEELLNGADPVLAREMIPVTISDDGTVTYADENNEWYNYSNKEWANAVLVYDYYNVGDIIPEDQIIAYFVWVPRYKYKIFDTGINDFVDSGYVVPDKNQSIDIKFETKKVSASSGDEVGEYLTHPAFTTLDVNGIWVGKFETSKLFASTPSEAEFNAILPNLITIKPNVYSWRGNKIYNMFVSGYEYRRNLDSHMMKNIEWGAVAYLSNSSYGINKKININNNSSFITGSSALPTIDQNIVSLSYGNSSSYNQPYNTEIGYLASTTGNITGIYDMAGGAAEYMSSCVGDYGFSESVILEYGSKYFDLYPGHLSTGTFSKRFLGDATGEIGPFRSYETYGPLTEIHDSWYGELANFISTPSMMYFVRGGDYDDRTLAGIFNFTGYSGTSNGFIGFRLVLAY